MKTYRKFDLDTNKQIALYLYMLKIYLNSLDYYPKTGYKNKRVKQAERSLQKFLEQMRWLWEEENYALPLIENPYESENARDSAMVILGLGN